jgi:hypothetical protein
MSLKFYDLKESFKSQESTSSLPIIDVFLRIFPNSFQTILSIDV